MYPTTYVHNIPHVVHNIYLRAPQHVLHNIHRVVHRIYVSLVGDMLWGTLYMLWRTTSICCGLQTCSPQHIFLMLSTTCHPQHIPRVLSTIHIYRLFPTTYQVRSTTYKYRAKVTSTRYSKQPQICCTGIHYGTCCGQRLICCGCMLWSTFICCGVHILWVTICCGHRTVHILWRYVVDNTRSSYMLWVMICCG